MDKIDSGGICISFDDMRYMHGTLESVARIAALSPNDFKAYEDHLDNEIDELYRSIELDSDGLGRYHSDLLDKKVKSSNYEHKRILFYEVHQEIWRSLLSPQVYDTWFIANQFDVIDTGLVGRIILHETTVQLQRPTYTGGRSLTY